MGDAFAALADPLQGWVTGCPEDRGGDPLATYFTPIVQAAAAAQRNATRDLAALNLRPEVRSSVESLGKEAISVGMAAEDVHRRMSCPAIHSLYVDMHTSVCCDLAYAFTAMWCVRLVTSFAILASAVAAIAGYKRFRRTRNLWGPYASIYALEVGSYL